MDIYKDLERRVGRLPINMNELGLGFDPELLRDSVDQGMPDRYLYEIVNDKLSDIELALLTDPYVVPPSNCGLDAGDVHIVSTAKGIPVRVSFRDGRPNRVTHGCAAGKTASGKSYCLSNLGVSSADECNTLIIDSNKTYRHIVRMHERHRFVRLDDLRINLWDVPDGVSAGQVDQIMNHEICKSYGLQFAEYEINEVVADMRRRGESPNLVSVIHRLELQTYKGWSNRARYRDSALLILNNLLRATGELFRCRKGMEIRELLEGNTVIEMSGLPEHQAMIVRCLFEMIHLLALGGG